MIYGEEERVGECRKDDFAERPPVPNRNGDLIKLRVFEDFFVDTALPKWKEYERRKKLFLEKIGRRGNSSL